MLAIHLQIMIPKLVHCQTLTRVPVMHAKGFFIVRNDRGLHTRPSTELVQLASKFSSHVTLKFKRTEVNAKSLLGILMLAATKGSKIWVEAEGKDAKEVVDAIIALAEDKFHLDY